MDELWKTMPEKALSEIRGLLCRIIVNEVEYKDDQLAMANQALLLSRGYAQQALRVLDRRYWPPEKEEPRNE
jgi:hypothetical protein